MRSSIAPRYVYGLAVGLACAASATAQVTYTIEDKIELLDSTFYDRPAHADPLFGSVSNDGTMVAFLAFDRATQDSDLYVVDVGNPDSFQFVHDLENLPGGENAALDPFFWSPDDSAIIIDEFRIALGTGSATLIEVIEGLDVGNGPEDRAIDKISPTRLPAGNLGIGRLPVSEFSLWPVGVATINPQGNVTPQPPGIGGFLTNIPGFQTGFISVAQDGDTIAMVDRTDNNIYALHGVRAIVQSGFDDGENVFFNTAVTDLGDPRIAHVRPAADGRGVLPIFSSSGEWIFFTDDYNEFFVNNGGLPFEEAIHGSDFDIVIARADAVPIDGENDATGDYRIAEPGTQVITSVSTGGNLIIVNEKTGALEEPFRLFLARVAVNETLTGDDLSGQMVEVDIDGTPTMITLSDNAVQLETGSGGALIEDGAGTTTTLPEGQIIEFPDGTTETTITVQSTSDVYSDMQLPPGAPQDSLAVAREFSPSGTNFYPPIEITYTYTDDDVDGLDEDTLTIYLLNETTMMFEPLPESDIVSRNPTQNQIAFKVDHFSTYALAGTVLSLPMRDTALFVMFALLAVAAGFAFRPARRNRQR